MKFMKKSMAFLLIAIMALGLTACGGDKDPKETTKETKAETKAETTADTSTETKAETKEEANALDRDTIVIGVDDTFAPMGFRDENNELAGFDIELATAVAAEMGVKADFRTIDWSMKETELNQGNIDVIWNGYTITDERKEKVAFTPAYLDNKQVVLVLADSGIESLADLEGKVVAAQTDSSAIEAIDSKPEIKDTFADLVTFPTNEECVMDLEAGRSDAVVADSVLLDYVVSHKDDPAKYVILAEDFGTEEYGIGVRKDDTALLDAINKAIEELKADGTVAEISTKWFGSDIVK